MLRRRAILAVVAVFATCTAVAGCSAVPATSHRIAESPRTREVAQHSSSGATPAPSSVPAPGLAAARLRGRRIAATRRTLRRLVHSRRPGSISVGVYDVSTGRETTGGAATGMMPASVAKVELLETLLLRAQNSGNGLSPDVQDDARAMIENSDNDAADDIYFDDGAGPGLVAAERPLGLSPTRTRPSYDDYWGLAPTSAPEQIALLRDLVLPSSPLDRASRHYALALMRDVESDQSWGVAVVADPHTRFAVKNGWLGIDGDDGLWAVNSDGVVTIDGHTVLLSVMTRHNSDYATGVQLVQRLARAAAAVVRAER